MDNIADIRRKFKTAKDARSPFEDDIREALYFALRQDFMIGGKSYGKTQDQNIETLDSTASEAVENKVKELQATMFPLSRPFITFKRNDENAYFSDDLEEAEKKFHLAIQHSNFYTEINLALKHAMIANGNIIVARGDNKNPLRYKTVPMWMCYHSENVAGMLDENFVLSEMTWFEIEATYGEYAGENGLQKAAFSQYDGSELMHKRLEVVEYFKTNADGTTNFVLFCMDSEAQDGDGVIFSQDNMQDLRFISFRYDRICGSVLGRGPVLKALPEIRTINEVQFYSLQKMIDVLGSKIAFDHSIIRAADFKGKGNIKTIDVPAGTPLPKVVEGSAQTLQTDNFVIDSLQTAIRRKIGDDVLPRADQGTRRTAAEFQIRSQSRSFDMVPDAANIERELYVPLVEVSMYILSMPLMAGSDYAIELPETNEEGEPLWRFEPENYLVATSKQQKADIIVNATVTQLQIFGKEAQFILNMPKIAREVASLSGIADKYLNSESEEAAARQAFQDQQQALIESGNVPQNDAPLVQPRENQ